MQNRLIELSPLRPVDWRYQRAVRYLANDQCPSESHDAPEICDLYQFLTELRACWTGRDVGTLTSQQSDRWCAFDINASCERESSCKEAKKW